MAGRGPLDLVRLAATRREGRGLSGDKERGGQIFLSLSSLHQPNYVLIPGGNWTSLNCSTNQTVLCELKRPGELQQGGDSQGRSGDETE